MGFFTLNRFKMTGPAVVMLATVVNAASMACCAPLASSASEVMGESVNSGLCARADLSWAVRGGATQGAQATRVLLAHKAISDIRTQDRVSLSQIPQIAVSVKAISKTNEPASTLCHTDSNHQYSAP